ncbi:hypothetical protein AI2799V1_4169 [Enterobacter cloacae]|uniref:DUF4153 domain-containing protein n=1 Tax=Enterobacter hormaechei TaxID=158836 RepID=UPI00079C897A|nr:DUF4153 domain-containing protein [Enterobacter hormaechei]CAE7824708.1 hypothetical protein AI2799V1_4169 [Enterobacter cloacae]HAV1900165.1 DUF4153 domain-containing protein [Enterobacter hormaechei subsp. steigerwaltii]MDN8572080.1 DUF4153 domain-containing protein [Enterobacter hormaechei]CAH3925827.1 hypothetical protein AI2799V1_4169 [Enterobacter cloacae]SAF34820.1 putative inner membrane protein [Enterobacter hormaechei]
MENREALSPSTRVAVVLAGALQGVICYVITWYIEYAKLPSDTLWLMCVVPATVVMTTTLSLAMTSFRKPFLWLSLGIIGAAVAGMGGWLKWSVAGLDNWDTRNAVLLFGFHLLLMTLLLLPWLQRRLETAPTDAFYRDFNDKNWHNALTFLLVFVSNGLFWLVLFLWAELFKLIGISFFDRLFFNSDWFISVAIGVVSASAAVLARMQVRLILALQNLLTLIATGLLPLMAALALLFIGILPFVGLEAVSARISAAGLLTTLALLLLLLVTVVWHPQRQKLPYFSPLRGMIHLAVIIAPAYPVLAGWALWLRIAQYGWSPERLYGVLITIAALVWTVGFCLSVLFYRRDPQRLQAHITPATGLLALIFLVLVHTPVLDPWRISVKSHMARYQDGRINADQVSLYMLSNTGRKGREAMQMLQNDPQFISNPKRQREINGLLSGNAGEAGKMTAAMLEKQIQLAPGMARPDKALWQAMLSNQYRFESCDSAQSNCLLMPLDLNSDGKPEAVLFQFTDRTIVAYTQTNTGWRIAGDAWKMPEALTREELDRALRQRKVKSVVKPWADIEIFGERVDMSYDSYNNAQWR